jgi:hypothetical protein
MNESVSPIVQQIGVVVIAFLKIDISNSGINCEDMQHAERWHIFYSVAGASVISDLCALYFLYVTREGLTDILASAIKL